jgi:hypothetical protein
MTWQWVTVILGLAFLTFSFFGFALVIIGKPAGSNDPAPRRDPTTEETQVIRPEKKGDDRT